MTDREERIISFIRAYHDKHQWAPTVREIADGVSLRSGSTVHGYLMRLQKEGKVICKGVRQIRVL